MSAERKANLAVVGLNQGWKFVDCLTKESDALGAQVVALCDKVMAANMPKNTPDVPVYEDYISMLDEMQGKIDGVIAALPNNLHLDITEQCAKRNVALLLEKPIAGSIEDAKKIVEISKSSSIPLLIGHHRRFSALVNQAKELIDSGRLGRLVGVNLMWALRKPDNYYDVKWRVTPGVGGPLVINAIHELDNMRYILGEVDSVQAFVTNEVRGNPVEDAGVANIRFKSGVLLSYFFSDAVASKYAYDLVAKEDPFYHPQTADCYYFFGEKGQLSFPSMTLSTYGANSGGSDWRYPFHEEVVPVQRFNPIAGETKAFADMILHGGENRCTASDATGTLLVIEAIRKSAETGRSVSMSEMA